ncbi:SDR family NAD(P)-dependent oxidoreductase [Longispora sp. K20-0274]|uniref:SDR family NAD(P)-dependent oxidoreductase n=1 Tax=Longispora sp. K20-0274 TaxID=3088255 RepID=UPI00399B1B87
MADPYGPPLAGRVALVTGAGGLIGAGIARRLARAGAAVVLGHCTSGAAAHALAGELTAAGGRATALAADLTDEAACRRLVDDAAHWGGRLDILVNNAGIQPVRPLADLTTAEWQAMADATMTSAFRCTQAAVAHLTGGGSVLHIASIEGTQPTHGHAHYSAAKAALLMFTRSAALEYGPLGIRVNAVSPGLIDRPGLARDWPDGVARWRAAAPLGRLGRPEDVGDACVFLASDGAAFITGHNLVVDGGVSTHPTW